MKTQAEFFVATMEAVWDEYGAFKGCSFDVWADGISIAQLMGGKEVTSWAIADGTTQDNPDGTKTTLAPAYMVQYEFSDHSRVDIEIIDGHGASAEVTGP